MRKAETLIFTVLDVCQGTSCNINNEDRDRLDQQSFISRSKFMHLYQFINTRLSTLVPQPVQLLGNN